MYETDTAAPRRFRPRIGLLGCANKCRSELFRLITSVHDGRNDFIVRFVRSDGQYPFRSRQVDIPLLSRYHLIQLLSYARDTSAALRIRLFSGSHLRYFFNIILSPDVLIDPIRNAVPIIFVNPCSRNAVHSLFPPEPQAVQHH